MPVHRLPCLMSLACSLSSSNPHAARAIPADWIKRQSLTFQLNFAPYYKAWGWQVTPETEAALASLPVYTLPTPPPPSPPPPPTKRPPPAPPAPPVAATADLTAADYQALAEGVGTINADGTDFSEMYMWSQAAAVAVSPNPSAGNAAAVVAAPYGAGRALYMGAPRGRPSAAASQPASRGAERPSGVRRALLAAHRRCPLISLPPAGAGAFLDATDLASGTGRLIANAAR